jgi:hypothetical protein
MTFKGSFAGHLDGVRVAQLVGREPAPHAAFDGEPAQMGTDRSRRPWPAAGRAFDHAEQPSDWQVCALAGPRSQLFPAPVVHADLAALAALAVTHEQRSATLVEVSLAEIERLSDAEPGPPQHDDQSARAVTVDIRAGVAHHGDDLLDPGRVGRVAQALVARRPASVVAGHRCG